MSPAGLSAAVAAAMLVMMAVLCCCVGGVSASEEHFAERLVQSLQGQDGGQPGPERFSETATSLRRRRLHLLMRQVPSLRSAFIKAMTYEANASRWTSTRRGSSSRRDQDAGTGDDTITSTSTSTGGGSSGGRVGTWLLVDRRSGGRLHQRHLDDQLHQQAAPTRQLAAPDAERSFSDRGQEFGAHPAAQQHSRPLLNITESPQGCSCSGVASGPERTLSFLISQSSPEERAVLDLHLPVVADSRSVMVTATVTLPTRLVLCVPGGAGRSVLASLRLKRGPQRPGWAHAIISDWLAQLQRRSAADGERCLQLVLPAGQAAVTLDRSGQRLAHISSRPLQYGGGRSSS